MTLIFITSLLIFELFVYYHGTRIRQETNYSSPNLHPLHLQVIDIENFSFVINNDICNQTEIALVTMVHTAVPNQDARNEIRQTWGYPGLINANTRLVFLLGETKTNEDQDLIEEENLKYKDIVQGGFLDTYQNMTYKNIMGKLWVSQFCKQAEFVVRADDDTYVDLYSVFFLAQKYQQTDDYKDGRFLLGPVKKWNPVQRDGKWAVTKEEFPDSTYPDYCNGCFYVFNPSTAARLVNRAKTRKFFWIDDVFVTGFLREDLNITFVDTNKYQMLDAGTMLKRKAVLKPNLYLEDYINTLVGRGEHQLKMFTALDHHARWCYLQKCRTNIYNEDYQPEEWEQMVANIVKNNTK